MRPYTSLKSILAIVGLILLLGLFAYLAADSNSGGFFYTATPTNTSTLTFTPTTLVSSASVVGVTSTSTMTATQTPTVTQTTMSLSPVPDDVLLGILFCQQTGTGYSLNFRTWYDTDQVIQWISNERIGLQIGDEIAACTLTSTHVVNCTTTASGKVQISNLVDGIPIRTFSYDLDGCAPMLTPTKKPNGNNNGATCPDGAPRDPITGNCPPVFPTPKPGG